jgi:hypothetical protein
MFETVISAIEHVGSSGQWWLAEPWSYRIQRGATNFGLKRN